MKFTLAFLIALIATVTALADSKTCLDVKQVTYNSHKDLACPAIAEVCLKDYDAVNHSAKSITLKGENGKSGTLPFDRYNVTYECIETFFGLSFSDKSHYVELNYINQHETNTEVFGSIRVYTGKKTDSNLSEQSCEYEVSAK